ncbi:TPA: tail fiber assembly protein [Escherichia coli]|nr:tail fiber assembly protein [Escherichia coli]HBA7894945.1 tail fiber assembly protein [Escherichia coli]HBA7905942.1 tail fiber assembly protein [Escherichia coli]
MNSACSTRTELLSSARQQLVISQTKLLRDRILSEDEQSSLDAWLDYIDAINALEFNNIKDKDSFNEIVWPAEAVLKVN